jgi:chromate reductase, NAD(P)H dehydrogenase (quinone)
MPVPKILVIPGSLRAQSFNARLAALATKRLMLADADVTRISLADYPLPIYDGDLVQRSGPPQHATALKRLICAHQGVLMVSPEYNASITPLLKNAIDWVSTVRERGEREHAAAFRHRVFALAGASPGRSGAVRPSCPSRSRSPTPRTPSMRWTSCATSSSERSSIPWCAAWSRMPGS